MGALQDWFRRTFARDERASETLELTEAMRSEPSRLRVRVVPVNLRMSPERRREVNLRAADTKRRKRETTAKLCEEIANRNGLHSHTPVK